MPKQRQIPRLFWKRLADGSEIGQWKPSKTLRDAGWLGQDLGPRGKRNSKDEAAVIAAAMALNEKVEDWKLGAIRIAEVEKAPRKWSFADLVDAYKRSTAYTDLAPATRREYDTRLKQLIFWAEDGKLPIRSIDSELVTDLRDTLQQNGASRFKVAAMLRVLRLLMNWAAAPGRRMIDFDPTKGVRIPTPPARATKLDLRGWLSVAAHVENPAAALAVEIAFWSMQRRSDLLALNRMSWRVLHGADVRDIPALAGPDGQIRGFRLQQQKTGRWVDCPMPPWLHARIDAAFETSQWLVPSPADPKQPMHAKRWERFVRPAITAAGFPDHQLRDTRRSGMSWVKDMGALKSDVFNVSGHNLLGDRKSMADVYMPPDTRAAIAAIAAAVRTWNAELEREQEQKG